MNSDHRLSAVRRAMVDDHLSAIVLTHIPNIVYITGFDDVFDAAANVACLITSEVARVYTDDRYRVACEAAAEGTPWVLRVPERDMYVRICDELMSEGVSEVAVESSVPYGRFRFISEQFRGRVRAIDHLVEGVREVKEAREIERITAAASVTDEAFAHILGVVVPGMTEADVALELEVYLRTHGSKGLAFDPIVASGPNSALPHAGVSDRVILEGDFRKLDFGARVGGYCADMTRTVVVGVASDRQREIHDAVLRANRAGIEACRAGRSGADIDGVAREVLVGAGFGENFTHGLGHGVGLEVHEQPSVSPRGRSPLRAGSVVTIEPGVYIDGFGGVRIEDLVVVEDGGCRVLSHSPKHLIEIETPA